eukprot:COSAG06_NODE_9266_length_1943_cov_1.715293_1_plen_626_part_01
MEAAAAPTESHGRPIEKHRVTSDEEFFHLVFSNKTENDERALEIRSELIRRAGLSIWQQTTNIPKDSDNWFNEWYPSASKAIKIPCYLTVNYLKSPYCMKEFGIALAKGKLLAIAIDPLSEIVKVDPSEFPHASNALAYLEGGGQVIFDDAEDTVAEILKFTPDVERMPAVAPVAPPAPKSPSPAPSSPGPANAWPAELAELMSIPAFVACLAELDVHSMVDFADCIDVDEGHDEQLRAVLEALPSKPRKNKVLRNRVLASLADLMQRLSIFIEYDSEEKASLSRVDCLRIPVEKMQAKAGGSIGEHFDKIDADKDGRITFEEMFEHTEVTAGEGTPPAQAAASESAPAQSAPAVAPTGALGVLTAASAPAPAPMAALPALTKLPRPAGTDAWTTADSLLESSWAKTEDYRFIRLVEVLEISVPALLQRYNEYKASMPPEIVNGNEKLVFHGCSAAVIDSIAEKGLLKSYQTSAAGSWQRFGPGFYFALQASKSHEYPIADMQALLPGYHMRKMILCKVARGNVLRTDINMDQLTDAPEGHHSVHGVAKADGPLNYDEIVVYKEAAILPFAIVTYEFEKLAAQVATDGTEEEQQGAASVSSQKDCRTSLRLAASAGDEAGVAAELA